MEIYKDGDTIHPESFEVSCKQDVIHRIFRASSQEEAEAWVKAVKSAIKARSLYRRETLNGINFLPGHAHEEHEHPLVSVVTLKRVNEKEVVLAKGPEYHYGTLFDVPYISSPSTSAGPPSGTGAPSPRLPGAPATANNEDVLSILLSNGDTAEIGVKSLSERAVGETVQVRVKSLAGHNSYLPVTIEASNEAKPNPSAAASKKEGQVTLLVDFLVPTTFVGILALFTALEISEHRLKTLSGLLSLFTKDRLALALLTALILLRAVIFNVLVPYLSKRGQKNMIMHLSIDDFVLEPKQMGEGDDEFNLPPIPKRFIDGCFGDMVEAERRWRITLAWRNEFGTDTILEQEHPYYDIIKEALPHFYCLTGKDGNPVYYERSGQTDLSKASYPETILNSMR